MKKTVSALPYRNIGIRKKHDKRELWAFIFCLPNIVLFLIFFIVPAIVGVWYSLTNFNGLNKMDFIGLQNYRQLLSDKEFYKVLANTAKYALVSVPAGYAIALGLALLLSIEKLKGIALLRILIYWPTLLSTIMVGLTWKWIFGEGFGLINYLLSQFGLAPVGWATNPVAAFITTVIASCWGCGVNMMIFIGGIKQIDPALKEAAVIDGAGNWQIFLNVIMPGLRPVSFMVIILSIISSFKVFALVQTLTNGGPGTATLYMIQYIYTTGFQKMRVGYSSAGSILLFFFLLLLSILMTKFSDKTD